MLALACKCANRSWCSFLPASADNITSPEEENVFLSRRLIAGATRQRHCCLIGPQHKAHNGNTKPTPQCATLAERWRSVQPHPAVLQPREALQLHNHLWIFSRLSLGTQHDAQEEVLSGCCGCLALERLVLKRWHQAWVTPPGFDRYRWIPPGGGSTTRRSDVWKYEPVNSASGSRALT